MSKSIKFLCENCGEVKDTHIETRLETYPVKGENTTISASVRVCNICGKDIYDEELDSKNLLTAYDIYRQKHGFITPKEIQALLDTYNISQRSLGALLNWGESTINRYINGSVPDEAHNNVLQLLQDPFNMQRIYEENSHRLNRSAGNKLTNRLKELLSIKAPDKVLEILSQASTRKQPDEYSGYIRFQPEILMEMIVYFAAKPGGILKTKLNKLLWYADFNHFRKYTISISGATYIHLPYGPVPDKYELYLCSLCEEGAISRIEEEFGNGFIGEVLISERAPRIDALPATGLEIVEAVYIKFKNTSSKQISVISHDEKGYIETKLREQISYVFADELNVIV